jgi:uncharacterized protein
MPLLPKIVAVDHLEVIIKLVEVCNLNCSYCYYYNKGDDEWKDRPKRISSTTVKKLLPWVESGISALDIKQVTFTLHGGEPLLLGKAEFERICGDFESIVGRAGAKCEINVQSNGILIDDEWVEIFERCNVSVGVSIDGPPEYQDRHRVDKRGRGSSEKLEQGIRSLMKCDHVRKGVLCVIDPSFDYQRVYQYLRNLGFTWLDFLVPMECYSNLPTEEDIRGVGKALKDVLTCWSEDTDQERVTVRIVDHYLRPFQQVSDVPSPHNWSRMRGHATIAVIAVHSNGDLGFREEIFTSGYHRQQDKASIFTSSLPEFVNSLPYLNLETYYSLLPEACRDCDFVGVCGGGDPKNRFHPEDQSFAHPSVYCGGLKMFYEHLVEYLISNGYPAEKLRQKLAQNAAYLVELQSVVV